MDQSYSTGEKNKARRIIGKALGMGYAVSVMDEEGEWAASRLRDERAVLDAIGETGMDELEFYNADGTWAGWMMLVWGNEPDGSELAADHTDNAAMWELAAA